MPPLSILVTGANGFVGRHLMPVLARRFPETRLLPASFDITDAPAVAEGIRQTRPDACVHLAGISALSVVRQNPAHAWQVNLHGTLHLADAILRHAPDCTLLFASSADAYGRSFAAGTPLAEDAPLAPMNAYAATKAAADLALGAMVGDGLRIIRARPFNHIGPGQSADFVVAAFARQITRIAAGCQEPILRVGGLEPLRDFLDVRDVCSAYAECLAQANRLPPGTVLNIASETPRRIQDMLNSLLALSGLQVEVVTDPARLRPSEIASTCGNAAAARSLLGWAPRIPWEQTLRDILEDWRIREG